MLKTTIELEKFRKNFKRSGSGQADWDYIEMHFPSSAKEVWRPLKEMNCNNVIVALIEKLIQVFELM